MNRILSGVLAGSLLLAGAGVANAQPYYGHGHHYGHGRYYGHAHHRWNYRWRRGRRMDRDAWRYAARVDWRRHHLRAPPRGYEWREVDGRYVLAAVATGLIADIILNAR